MIVVLYLAVRTAGGASPDFKALTVRDDSGKTRAALMLIKNEPVLEFYDSDGKEVLGGLKMIKDDSGFLLYDGNHKLRINLSIAKDTASLILYDNAGRARTILSANPDKAGVFVGDEKGRPRADLTVDKTGPHLLFKDENGKVIETKP
jgi:hypothetical protein